jgi:hypothetical protein
VSQDDHLKRQAWDYFALHAQQRLTTLNFFVVLATALTATAVTSFDNDFRFPLLRLPAGLMLAVLSVAFWRLDLRNRDLIKAAEAALRQFEVDAAPEAKAGLQAKFLFCSEHEAYKRRREMMRWWQKVVPRSYSDVFNLLFALFFIAGVVMATFAA